MGKIPEELHETAKSAIDEYMCDELIKLLDWLHVKRVELVEDWQEARTLSLLHDFVTAVGEGWLYRKTGKR